MKCCLDVLPTFSGPRLKIALVGNPNVGKTTLFNALTGSCQKIGNWPGVTVERKSGFFQFDETLVEVVDLPGTYSLVTTPDMSSVDEQIVCDFMLHQSVDLIVNVIDASHLERNLYLTTQLLEMQLPMVVAVNKADQASVSQLHIAYDVLSKRLGVPVVSLAAKSGEGIDALKQLMKSTPYIVSHAACLPSFMNSREMKEWAASIQSASYPYWFAIRLLENDTLVSEKVSEVIRSEAHGLQHTIQTNYHEEADSLIAEARYQFIQETLKECLSKEVQKTTWTDRIDRIVLNRFLGIPLFLLMMYGLFFLAITLGGWAQKELDYFSNRLLVEGVSSLLMQIHAPLSVVTLFANGIGKGICTTITFIPVMAMMFFLLAFLEESGYMTRAAFVIDRVMQLLGLPGKSFVPMMIGFGCNVPAVMASRTLENKRDRILTIMMMPFMSCGARLAIYSAFVAAFFPTEGHNVVFALYLIGISVAMLTGWMLRKTLLQGKPAPLVMEMPSYQWPTFKTLLKQAGRRLNSFIMRAGKLLIPICVLLGFLNTMMLGKSDTSLLSWIGQSMTPIFAPMGIHADNWPATVGLLTGVLAKEVVIGSLNTLYSQMAHWTGSVSTLSYSAYGVMYQHFEGAIGAFAYLLFVLLYFPCLSTVSAVSQELHRGWAYFSVFWSTVLAYCVAVSFYQLATVYLHPFSSCMWLVLMGTVIGLIVAGIRLVSVKQQAKWVPLPEGT